MTIHARDTILHIQQHVISRKGYERFLGRNLINNFDEGDGAFLKTIPSLIDGLHDMARYVQAQTKIPQMYSKVFLNCPDCKP